MSTVDAYITDIVQRARVPMEPRDFEPDWEDKPYRHKVYPGAARLPLPPPQPADPAPDSATGATAATAGPAALADLLHHSLGLLGRRLALQGNDDKHTLPRHHQAVWHRGTANGGGLYPVEAYWATAGSAGFDPGVYSYSAPHHAMLRLLAGDTTGRIRDAVAQPPPECGDFLLLSVKFWKNTFKYSTFGYHVVSTDVGTVLGTWQTWTRDRGLPLRPLMSLDSDALDRLLGLAPRDESVFAVVPVPWAGDLLGAAGTNGTGGTNAAGQPGTSGADTPAVTRREAERSRHVIHFERNAHVHRAVADAAAQPARPAALDDAVPRPPDPEGRPRTPLPEPARPAADLRTALRTRRSSFGRFSAKRPLDPAELSAVLHAVASGGLDSDAKHPGGGPALTRPAVFVNHVRGVQPGGYDYLPGTRELALADPDAPGQFLQHTYFLTNYNLEQAAAALVVVARPHAAVAARGPLGYRLVNAEVGAVVQAGYLACAAAGIGCGAAFGFDAVAYRERLGLEGTDQWPLVVLMIGHERPGGPDYDYRLT